MAIEYRQLGRRRLGLRMPADLATRHLRPGRKLKEPIQDFIEKFELPRWHYKPIDGIDFDRDDDLAVTAAMGYTNIVSVTLPAGMEGVIKYIGQGADAAGLFTDGRWRLLLNSEPYRDWNEVAFQRGTMAALTPVTILLPAGSVFSFQVRNTHASNTYTAQARLVGWYWIQKDVRYSTLE
jgi:hypothetical protein